MIAPRAPKQTAADERRARAIVTERDGGACVKCHRAHPVHGVNWDHRKNRGQGGLWAASNGQLLCGSGTTGCHGWKTQNPAAAAAEGWAVPAWADPLTYPARRYVEGLYGILRLQWVLYRDDGQWEEITVENAERRIREGRMYEEEVA